MDKEKELQLKRLPSICNTKFLCEFSFFIIRNGRRITRTEKTTTDEYGNVSTEITEEY
jgi:hypothetical protein